VIGHWFSIGIRHLEDVFLSPIDAVLKIHFALNRAGPSFCLRPIVTALAAVNSVPLERQPRLHILTPYLVYLVHTARLSLTNFLHSCQSLRHLVPSAQLRDRADRHSNCSRNFLRP